MALAVAVALGAPVTLCFRDRPGAGTVLLDLALDLAVGVLAGMAAVGLILPTAALLGGFIFRIQRAVDLERRARSWQPPRHREPRLRRIVRQLVRGAALGAAGLLLSAAGLALATTVSRNRTGGAEAPLPVLRSALSTIALPVVLWFAGTAAVWAAFSRWHVHRDKAHLIEPHRRLRHGTHGTALAIGLLVLGGWLAARWLEQRAEHRLWSGKRQPVASATVTPAQWNGASPYLAQQFEPRFWLSRDERWSPTSVSWYLRHRGATVTGAPFCQHGGGCYQIGAPDCDGARPRRACAPSGANAPALYYRYCSGSECGRGAPRAPGASWKLIQYWIFYNYDSLKAGAVTQWHQSDWEQMSVLVRRTRDLARPVEVAFSEHCYGGRLPAQRVRWQGTHPVSYVGEGSHANYPRPVRLPVRELRCSLGLTPRYFGVAGLFFEPAFDGTSLELPIAYLIGLRDRAERARPAPPLPLLSLAATPAVSGFKGYWGLDNNLEFLGWRRLRTGAGPSAPPTQGPWREPFPAMLCSDRWLSVASGKRSAMSWACDER